MSSHPERVRSAAIEDAASDWVVRREGNFSAAEERTYRRWIAADARHAEAIARLEKTWALLSRPRMAGRADEMTVALQARVARRRRRRTGAALATLLLILSGGAVWRELTPERPFPPAANAVVIVAQRQILSDGTVVELRPGAEIRSDYSGPLRRVALRRGEAVFHVAKDAHRPFVVTAAGVELRAVGTAFAVQVADDGVEVVVTEGQVAVERPMPAPAATESTTSPPPPPPAYSTLLDAGNRISLDLLPGAAAPQVVEISAAEIAERLAWRAPRIEFSNTPLAEAVALMNRHATVQLIVDDAKLAGVPVNGLFRADNTDALVRLLEASFGVSSERRGNTITLRRRP